MQPFGGGGVAGGGYGSLYNQFTFLDVGVNVDITPTVHGNGEVTLKVMLDISTVRDRVDIAGVSQPLIGQRKVEHEIRIREGEASLLGGLMQIQDTKVVSGIPGLGSIPVLKRLFTSESREKDQSELLIALIPHIVRTPGITDLNLRPVAAGTENVTRMSLTPRAEATAPAAPAAPAAQPPAGAPPAQPPPVPAQPQPVPTQPQPVSAQPQSVPAQPQPVPAQPASTAPQPVPPAPQAPPAPISPAPMRLLFRPGSVQARSGSTFTLQLDADSARDLVAAPFHLKFDPQLLRLQEIAVGGLLSSDGQKVIFTRNILNDAGDATVNLNRLPGAGGVNGSGTLAVFTFQAIKPGATVVTFSELGARNSAMQPVTTDLPHAGVMIQ
jgi:general secretion pathway protein D